MVFFIAGIILAVFLLVFGLIIVTNPTKARQRMGKSDLTQNVSYFLHLGIFFVVIAVLFLATSIVGLLPGILNNDIHSLIIYMAMAIELLALVIGMGLVK